MKKQKTNIGRLIRVVCIAMFAAIAASLLGLAACKPNEPAHKHTLTAVSKQDATCTDNGNEAYWKCDGCGKMFSDGEGKNEIQSVPEIAAKGHSVPTMTETKSADCTNKGQKSGKCKVCQQTVTEDIPALGHNAMWTAVDEQTHIKKCTRCEYTEGDAEPHNFVGDECTDCGAKKAIKPYTLSEDGKTLTFGSYPQSKVEDTALQSMLNAAIQNKTPTADDFNGWTDYEYRIGGTVNSFMWYKDVEYQEAKYRGVYFDDYRPSNANSGSGSSGSNQDENGYSIGTVYWFKFEPITLRILTQHDGKAFLVADLILDCMEVNSLSNKYDESRIRDWLNNAFVKTALGDAEQFVAIADVDNSAASTASPTNSNVCDNTNDKVFLLSYAEVTNEEYGFDFSTRRLSTSEYAKCQGAYTKSGYGWWLLRSPYDGNTFDILYVSNIGYVSAENTRRVNETQCGVVPALWLTL